MNVCMRVCLCLRLRAKNTGHETMGNESKRTRKIMGFIEEYFISVKFIVYIYSLCFKLIAKVRLLLVMSYKNINSYMVNMSPIKFNIKKTLTRQEHNYLSSKDYEQPNCNYYFKHKSALSNHRSDKTCFSSTKT